MKNNYNFKHPNYEIVKQEINKLNISIIDIHEEVFEINKDPLSLFPFGIHGHYNADGYRLVAEAIQKRIIEDGYVSIKLRE